MKNRNRTFLLALMTALCCLPITANHDQDRTYSTNELRPDEGDPTGESKWERDFAGECSDQPGEDC